MCRHYILITLNVLIEFSFILFCFILFFAALILIRFHMFTRHRSSLPISFLLKHIFSIPIYSYFKFVHRNFARKRFFYFYSIYGGKFRRIQQRNQAIPMRYVHTIHHTFTCQYSTTNITAQRKQIKWKAYRAYTHILNYTSAHQHFIVLNSFYTQTGFAGVVGVVGV